MPSGRPTCGCHFPGRTRPCSVYLLAVGPAGARPPHIHCHSLTSTLALEATSPPTSSPGGVGPCVLSTDQSSVVSPPESSEAAGQVKGLGIGLCGEQGSNDGADFSGLRGWPPSVKAFNGWAPRWQGDGATFKMAP